MSPDNFRRFVLATAAISCSVIVGACSSPSTTPEEGGGPASDARPAPSELAVVKDALASPPCDLLPADVAQKIGVEPGGEEQGNRLEPQNPKSCSWKSADGSVSFAFSPLPGRTIQDYRDNKSEFSSFEEISVAGNPAVAANRGDPMQDGLCAVFWAANDGQLVSGVAQVPKDQARVNNPCDISKNAFEMSVSGWPAAK